MIRWYVQMAVLAALIVVFGMQIPRSALFFKPVKALPAPAHAAFVTLDDAAYVKLMRRVGTAESSVGSRNWNEGPMSMKVGPVVLEDELQPPPELHLPESFTHAPAYSPSVLSMPSPSLKPPSLSLPPLPPVPAAAPSARKPEKKADPLLDIDSFESLKERQ